MKLKKVRLLRKWDILFNSNDVGANSMIRNVNDFSVHRFDSNPIISQQDLKEAGLSGSITHPSLIKVPSWISNPLGKYYIYFADHYGKFIRLAYSDSLHGPWRIYNRGTLYLKNSFCHHHIASPHIYVDEKNKQLRMYYHGFPQKSRINIPEPEWINKALPKGMQDQKSFMATSTDGINFISSGKIVAPWYVRTFAWKDEDYIITMPGIVAKYNPTSDVYEFVVKLFNNRFRHCDVLVVDDLLYVFYTNAGDNPEHIICSKVVLNSEGKEWKIVETFSLVYPEMDYEGGFEPRRQSIRGGILKKVHELRDPCIYTESGNVYMLYCGGGEHCLVISHLKGLSI